MRMLYPKGRKERVETMKENIINIAAFLFIFAVWTIIYFARRKEKKTWNDGYCDKCGSEWKLFDRCFCGDRGYHCPKCNRYIWISYNVDKKKDKMSDNNKEGSVPKVSKPTPVSNCSMCKHNVQSMEYFDECYNCVGLGTGFAPNEQIKRLMLLNGWHPTGEKATRIVLGFPGVGKTYVKEKYKGTSVKVLDSDSSNFDKSGFPNNYIEYIKSCIGKYNLIMISTHEAVRKAIAKSDIMDRAIISICYPSLELKEDWLIRLANRGNSEEFINLIRTNYDQWIKDIENEDVFYKERLERKDEYLSCRLYHII